MNRTLRSLVIIAGVAVLAASSQATITFSPLTSDISVSTNPTNQVSAIPPRLSAGVFGNVSVTDTGSTLVTSTSGISTLSVDEAGGYAFSGASVSLTVTLYKGNNTSYPSVTLFSDSTTSSFLSNSVTTVNLGAGDVDLITFSATYTGTGAPFSGGVVGAFTIAAEPAATPEPAAYATFGVGLVGLIIRRRRSTK